MRTTLLAPGSSIADWAQSATRQLHEALGNDLVAAYLIGSSALGGFVPEQSDVDMVAICAEPLRANARGPSSTYSHGRP
jgi:predicted nucleotidyltransferase